MAGTIGLHDVRCTAATRREQHILDCSLKPTPELQIFYPKIRPGCSYETLTRKRGNDNDIFICPGQGICPSKDRYELTKTEAHTFAKVIEMDYFAAECEDGDILESQFDDRATNVGTEVAQGLVRQLYSSKSSKGFPGLPDIADICVDALDPVWACQEGLADKLTDAQKECMSSIYLVKAAQGEEDSGLAMFWGNNQTIKVDEREKVWVNGSDQSCDDDGCKTNCQTPKWRQLLHGAVGLQNHCDSVVRIKNVPTSKIAEFGNTFILNVLSQAFDEFSATNQPTHILMDRKAYTALWLSLQNHNNNGTCCIVPPTDDALSDRFSILEPYGITIVRSWCMPKESYVAPAK